MTQAPDLSPLLTYAVTLDNSQILMGIIVSVVLGFTAGNYACSLVHRLPRGLGIVDKKPYCGSCGTMLATKDLFPVFSALLLNHKCRYCGAAIPKSHFYTELTLGLLFCLCFAKWGFSEQYTLIALLGSMLTVLASIHYNDQQIDRRVLIAVLVTGLLFRTLVDASLFPSLQAGLFATIIAALIWRKEIKKHAHIYVLPTHALICITGAMIVGLTGLLVYFLLYALLWAICTTMRKDIMYTLPFSLAVIATLLLQ